MLKIKKTKPYQHKSYIYYICILTLICGIVPSLALSTYYNADKTYAAGADITSISTMQEMKSYICDNTEIGTSHTLTDTRDESTYTVSKLNDGKCWMTQNLKLDLTKAGVATAAESDNLSTNFPAEALISAEKFTDDGDATQFSKSPIINNSYPGDNKGYQTEYGYYYSWCAATGGTCMDVSTDGADASGSICPKGWRLPKGGTGAANEFAIMGGITASVSEDANYWSDARDISFSDKNLTVNGNDWIAAGFVNIDGLSSSGFYGRYWSSTASSSAYAYNLRFYNNYFIPAYVAEKYVGRTVRCIAEGWPSKDVNVVAVRVSPVISIDATSGMNKEVDPNLVTTGEISATISANTTYAVQLSANKTSLTNPNNSEEITSTNSIPASSNVQAKTNAWGILNSDNTTYSAITTNPTTYYNTESTNEDSSRTHTFILGVSVSPTLPAGEYSTTVTITAVNN